MYWQLISFAISLILSALVSAALAFYAWRRRQTPEAMSFALLMLAVTVWSLGYVLELWNTDLSAMLWWVKVEYLGVVSVPVLWLIFALQYAGREKWLTRRNLIMLLVIPLLILLLNWTNEFHRLYYLQVGLVRNGPFVMLSIIRGFWYWVGVVYAYLLILLGTATLGHMFVRSARPYRGQIGVVLGAAFIPWAANVLYIFGLNPFPGLNLTPLAFTLTGLVMAWGLFRFKLLDLVPVARDKVVESMNDCVIVLDAKTRIVDINPAAQELIGRPSAQVIGQPLDQVFSGQLDLVEGYLDLAETQVQIVLGEAPAQRYYDLDISPIYGQGNQLRGRLVVLHDITERQQTEQALQTLNHRMQDELALAHEIQQSLLPPAQPGWSYPDVICYSATARELGGDFYRYHAFGYDQSGGVNGAGKYAFAVGDVSGKGVSAALLMAVSLSQFDAALSQKFSPQARLAYLDRAIAPYTKPRGQNCALCYAELDLTGLSNPSGLSTLHIVNAGCIPPYIRHQSGKVDWPELGGFALGQGLSAEHGYDQITLEVSAGDLIILISDGVVEAHNAAGEMFGFERLAQVIASGPANSAAAMIAHLTSEVVTFMGEAEPHDDMTMIVVGITLP